MAKITASVFTSHVPAIGAALDLGKTQEPYWQPVFKGYEFGQQWMKDNKPDVIFLVFNDHATAFSLDFIPTFAMAQRLNFSLPMKAGGRALCQWSKAIQNWHRTLHTRSFSKTLI